MVPYSTLHLPEPIPEGCGLLSAAVQPDSKLGSLRLCRKLLSYPPTAGSKALHGNLASQGLRELFHDTAAEGVVPDGSTVTYGTQSVLAVSALQPHCLKKTTVFSIQYPTPFSNKSQ